ncbi:MAG: hypothetical protein KA210_01355 [Bacteroidia bacterium]|nr:hypothetical protein [Bacteroidia bacterium]
METSEYKKILLDVAVCAISCDGIIDEREINELNEIEKTSPYFSALDLSEMLETSLKECTDNNEAFQQKVFEILDTNELNIVQELSIIDISLKIIAADEKEEDVEIQFLKSLRSHLKVEDVIIKQRFGSISYLSSSNSEFKNFANEIEILTKEQNKK